MAWIVLLIAAAVTAAGQSPAPEFLPERSSECYDCHASDAVPLRTFYLVVPEPSDSTNGPFEFQVQIQNAWLHDQRYLGPVLDLSNAPSLKFFDGREPVTSRADGRIDLTPRPPGPPQLPSILPDLEPTQGPYSGNVTLQVPSGATRAAVQMTQTNNVGNPTITWSLFTGRNSAEGEPDRVTTSQGETAEFLLATPDDFAGISYGNWTIQAQVQLDTDINPAAGELTFRVDLEADFASGDSRTARLGRQLQLGPGQSTLFTWTLQPVATAGPGENARLDVEGAAYYAHETAQGPDSDWAYTTKGLELAVEPTASGGVRIGPDADSILVVVPSSSQGISLPPLLEAIGYLSTFLIVASIYSGGIFGRPSRRHLNHLFGTARRRVAFHNVLSYALTLAALVHTVLFIYDGLTGGLFHWTLGLIWGGVAILAMFALGVTGALQVHIIRRWNYATWRWTHLGLAIITMVFTVLHLLLDGVHFAAVQEWLGYSNPLDPRTQ